LNAPDCIEAPVALVLFQHLVCEHRAILAGVLGDLPQRRLHGLAHHVDADALVVVVGIQLRQDQRGAGQGAAAGDDAFLDCCAGRMRAIIHAIRALLHFHLGGAADADDGHAAGQFDGRGLVLPSMARVMDSNLVPRSALIRWPPVHRTRLLIGRRRLPGDVTSFAARRSSGLRRSPNVSRIERRLFTRLKSGHTHAEGGARPSKQQSLFRS
jgi:hypothetical protein